ncbi:MAG TPA: tRNA pseudouridine(55) synthase TruB [Acidimicrobiaceae bacterium]|nr:tRNA pseudouridine(55) synthase TruB [Acidimicrobiaceae bacterium]
MARRRPPTVHGMALVDKPAAMTSHDVVAVLRKRFDERRIGHAGTLDPDATGLLVAAVGSATRLLRFAAGGAKRYECVVRFGTETDTLDAAGTVTARHGMAPTPDGVSGAAAAFLGETSQTPPMVSAVSVGGRRLHELARAGIEVEREPRTVEVTRFDLAPTDDPLVYRAVVECGPGTYVRVLAADLGHALGGGAHIDGLRRTRSGEYDVRDARPPEAAELRPVADLVAWMDTVELTGEEAARVADGGRLDPARTPGDGPWALSAPAGGLAAVHERADGVARPAVVFPVPLGAPLAAPPAPPPPRPGEPGPG